MRLILACLLICFAGCDGPKTEPLAQAAEVTQAPTVHINGPSQSVNGRWIAVFMGDSITERWPGLTDIPGMVDAGISSQTSAMMLARFQADVIDRDPDYVVILAGTNDVLTLTDPNTDNVARMAEMASAHGIRVILCTLPPSEIYGAPYVFSDLASEKAAIVRFNDSLKLLAKGYGYTLIDYYSAMIRPDGSQEPSFFQVDHVHPSDAGYEVMWHLQEKLFGLKLRDPLCAPNPESCK